MKRIIIFIVIFAIFICFIILNLENKCDISYGFNKFSEVPIYLSTLISFTLGMLITIPLLLTRKKRQKVEELPKVSDKLEVTPDADEIKKEGSPYGID